MENLFVCPQILIIENIFLTLLWLWKCFIVVPAQDLKHLLRKFNKTKTVAQVGWNDLIAMYFLFWKLKGPKQKFAWKGELIWWKKSVMLKFKERTAPFWYTREIYWINRNYSNSWWDTSVPKSKLNSRLIFHHKDEKKTPRRNQAPPVRLSNASKNERFERTTRDNNRISFALKSGKKRFNLDLFIWSILLNNERNWCSELNLTLNKNNQRKK